MGVPPYFAPFLCHMLLKLRLNCPMLSVMTTPDVLLRPSAVARRLSVSRSSVYRWFWEGKLKGVKLHSGTVRILASSVQELLDAGD